MQNLTDPVGLPGLIAILVGFAGFTIALLAARRRKGAESKETVAMKASITWLWIAVQSIGIGLAGLGSIRVELDPDSPKAIVEGVVVLALMTGTIGIFDASSRAMGKNWALVARTREDHILVQTGPFARIRHPIYVALFLFMLALAVAFGHTHALMIAVPVYALGTWLRVAQEERLLRAQFGTVYDNYAGRVKRFVPGVF